MSLKRRSKSCLDLTHQSLPPLKLSKPSKYQENPGLIPIHDLRQMDSINYSSENQESEQPEHDLAGIGRSYDCVYCKRGFNTAQALGGHMNIHRKDRARNPKPNNLNDTTSSYNPNKAAGGNLEGREQNYGYNNTTLKVPMYYHQVSTGSYPPAAAAYHHHQASQLSYRTYFPASTSTPVFANHHYYSYNTLDCDDDDDDSNNPQCLNLFGEDWRLSLHHVDDVENYQDDGVDLELRLGHDR